MQESKTANMSRINSVVMIRYGVVMLFEELILGRYYRECEPMV